MLDRETFTFSLETVELKNQWMKTLSKVIEDLSEMEHVKYKNSKKARLRSVLKPERIDSLDLPAFLKSIENKPSISTGVANYSLQINTEAFSNVSLAFGKRERALLYSYFNPTPFSRFHL